MPGDAGLRAGAADLLDDLLRRPTVPFFSHAARGDAGPEEASLRVLPRPPREQRRKALLFLVDGPVELRREVVDPAALDPRARVGRDFLVRVESLHLRRAPGPPDAEGADAHPNLRLRGLHLGVEALHEPVHVPPAPVLPPEGTSRSHVLPEARPVRKLQDVAGRVSFGIGIEIVVEVNAIHVVPLHDVENDRKRVRRDVLLARIEPELFPVGLHEVRTAPRDVPRRGPRQRRRRASPIRIEPGVELHPARVRFGDREGERIPEGLGRDALRAAQDLRPRLERGRIERVRGGPHLEDHRVRVQRGQGVEEEHELLLLASDRKAGRRRPVDV